VTAPTHPAQRPPALWLRLAERGLARVARATLEERFGDDGARRLVEGAVRGARATGAQPRTERGVGGRLMVHAAALTASLYHQLRLEGFDPDGARRETARVTWAVYRRMARVPWLWARLAARSPEGRLRRAIGAFRRFPFGPPAYRMRDLPIAPGTVAFDVERCPVAEHLRGQGLGELCVEAWCNLDYPLAERWGARLERTSTIAGGGDKCDFRWHARADRPPGG